MPANQPDFAPADRRAQTYGTDTRAPCTCDECKRQYLMPREERNYLRRLVPEDAIAIAEEHMTNINKYRKFLQQALHGGATISNRWRRFSRRCRYLETVKLDILETQISRPSIQDLGNEWKRQRWLAPYLNMEQLKSDSSFFLSLLYHRANCSPEEFAAQDNCNASFAWDNRIANLNYSEAAVCMSGAGFGKLKKWDKASVHSWNCVGYPRGILVLEAQAFIFRVICKLLLAILHGDQPVECPASISFWMREFSLGFKSKIRRSIRGIHFSLDLTAPIKTTYHQMASCSEAHLRELEHHTVRLQTDSDYMGREIEMIRASIPPESLDIDVLCIVLLRDLMHDIVDKLMWAAITEALEYLHDLCQRYNGRMRQGQKLPEEVDFNLAVLERYLISSYEYSKKHTETTFRKSPGFGRTFRWKYGAESKNNVLQPVGHCSRISNPTLTQAYQNDPLEWCISQILRWSPQPYQDGSGVPDLIDRVDYHTLHVFLNRHLSGATSQERDRVTPRLRRELASLISQQHLLEMIRLQRPLPGCYSPENIVSKPYYGESRKAELLLRRIPFGLSSELRQLPNSVIKALKVFYKLSLQAGSLDPKYASLPQQALDKFWPKVFSHHQEKLSEFELQPDANDTRPFSEKEDEYLDCIRDFEGLLEKLDDAQATADAQSSPPVDTCVSGAPDPVNLARETGEQGIEPANHGQPADRVALTTGEDEPEEDSEVQAYPPSVPLLALHEPLDQEHSCTSDDFSPPLTDTDSVYSTNHLRRVSTSESVPTYEKDLDGEKDEEDVEVDDSHDSDLDYEDDVLEPEPVEDEISWKTPVPKKTGKEKKQERHERKRRARLQAANRGESSSSKVAGPSESPRREEDKIPVYQRDFDAIQDILNGKTTSMNWYDFENLMKRMSFGFNARKGGSFKSQWLEAKGLPCSVTIHKAHDPPKLLSYQMADIRRDLRRHLRLSEDSFRIVAKGAEGNPKATDPD